MNNRVLAYGATLALVCAWSEPLVACDTDAECGVGGVCIKREKRARGVCYGGDYDQNQVTEQNVPAMVDPAAILVLPPGEAPEGSCFVTQDCPVGLECVKAGLYGTCHKLN